RIFAPRFQDIVAVVVRLLLPRRAARSTATSTRASNAGRSARIWDCLVERRIGSVASSQPKSGGKSEIHHDESQNGRSMRLWITELFRMKVVLADAALYILCALTSSGALAYTENNGVAHCPSEAGSPARAHTVQTASSHFRSDGTWREHHSNGTQHKHDG